MTQVAKPRKIVQKSRFRVEIDGIGDFRAVTAGPGMIKFNISKTEEGGAQTTVDISINGYAYDPISIERPLTEDTLLVDWVKNQKAGIQDRRNGAIYALDTEGVDMYRWDLEEISLVSFEDFSGDSKAKSDSMMEKITIEYRERSERVSLQ